MNHEEMKAAQESELLERLNDLGDAIASIRHQVETATYSAKATGEYADREWFSKARFALKAKGREHQRIQAELRARKVAKKQGRRLSDYFMDAAREMLPEGEFYKIADAARIKEEEAGL